MDPVTLKVVVHNEQYAALFMHRGDYPLGQFQYELVNGDWYELIDTRPADKVIQGALNRGMEGWKVDQAIRAAS